MNSIVATKCTCCLRNFNDTIKKTALTVKVKSQLVDLIQSKVRHQIISTKQKPKINFNFR